MAKPASLPEWASDGTLIVEPAAGLKASGWVNGTRPPAKYQNWYQELVYRWCEYLDSGAFEGNHSVDGNLSTINGGTMTAAGLLTASAGVTAAANQHVTVSGTGRFKHGDIELVIPGAAFTPAGPNYGGTVQVLDNDWAFAGGPPNDTIIAGVVLAVGIRVRSIVWHINKASSGSGMELTFRRRNGTTNANIDTVSDVTSGAAYTTNSRTGIDYTVVSGDALQLKVAVGSTSHRFSHAVLTIDRP